jgi:hypothetical protein
VREAFFYVICAVLVGIAVRRAVRARAVPESPKLSVALSHEAFLAVTDKEDGDRREAAFRFQGSNWSQQDEFHSRESKTIRGWAGAHHVTSSAVVNALDRGMREGWPVHPGVEISQKVFPCRPRLSY